MVQYCVCGHPMHDTQCFYYNNPIPPSGEIACNCVTPTLRHDRPYVGVGVLVFRNKVDGANLVKKEVLYCKRKGSHGAGIWALAGGHLEYGEDWMVCAQRELREETGLLFTLDDFFQGPFGSAIFPDIGRHYITLFAIAKWFAHHGEPKLMEPNKAEEWVWLPWGQVPGKAFAALEELHKKPLEEILYQYLV